MTRLDSGEVFRFDNGRFSKVIAQPGIMRSLWYSFPLSQLIEEAFIPYVQTDQGWIGAPDPIRGPDGKVMIPRDAIFSFTQGFSRNPTTYANAAIKTVAAKEDELKRRERIRKVKIIKSYADDVRRAPPEKRAAMIEILKDMAESVRPETRSR